MNNHNRNKLKKILQEHLPGTICLASWLEARGISRNLQTCYRRSGWLESVGPGAFKRPGEQVTLEGALYAIQEQAGLPVHLGGQTALSRQGLSQYIRMSRETAYLYSPLGVKLPAWFKRYDWKVQLEHIRTNFIPDASGLGQQSRATSSLLTPHFSLKLSAPERAIMECLYLAPNRQDLVEIFQIMEGLTNLRPKIVQRLLETCRSVKVKRLFLYMADKAGHKWLQFVDRQHINLGRGNRCITPNGVYVAEHCISIPKTLVSV